MSLLDYLEFCFFNTNIRIALPESFMNEYSCPLCDSKETDHFLTDYSNNRYWKCKKCKLLFLRPVPKISYDDGYWKDGIDPEGKKKDQTKMKDFKLKNWYGEIVSYVNNLPPGKIIDIGCGLGYLLSAIPNTWDKHGYETSEFALSYVKNENPEVILEELKLESEPPPKNQMDYDVVICYHVIEHIKNPDLFLKHLSMMVKPHGVLIVGTPNVGSIAAKLFRGNFRLFGSGHLCLFNQKNLEFLFKKNHFKIFKKEFPFLKTDYFTLRNFLRIFNTRNISPPFYGNIMTFYGEKMV